MVLSSPSGGGKSTIIKEILKRSADYLYSVSATTRSPRHYEQDGVHYHFLSPDRFREGIRNGEFLEWEEVHQDLYGTPRAFIEQALKEGKVVLLDLDVNGGLKLKRLFPDETILIFIIPPSPEELVKRLRGRGETEEVIKRRLQRLPMEIEQGNFYTYRLVNKNLEETVNAVIDIIEQNREREERRI